jgi:hypothetical protein
VHLEHIIDYRSEDGRLPVSEIFVTIQNPGSLSSSGTAVDAVTDAEKKKNT